MPNVRLFDRTIKVDFTVEEFCGILNRRDNTQMILNILNKSYENDPVISECCRYLQDNVDTFSAIMNKLIEEFNKIKVEG